MAYLGQTGGAGQVLAVGSGGSQAWSNKSSIIRNVYEIDFATVAAETILNAAGTATRTYGGITWTFEQTGVGSISTSAAGLNYNLQNGAAMFCRATVTNFGVYNPLQGNWRMWLHNSVFTKTANSYAAIYAQYGPNATPVYSQVYQRTFDGSGYYDTFGPTSTGGNVNRPAPATEYDILIVENTGGQMIARGGLDASGHWNNLDACRVFSVGSFSDTALATATTGKDLSGAQVMFYGTASVTLTNTFRKFKMEVW